MKQVVTLSTDTDTGAVEVVLASGERYYITQPAHARRIVGRISVGGRVNPEQVKWLERYRVAPEAFDRGKLVQRLRQLREELGGQA